MLFKIHKSEDKGKEVKSKPELVTNQTEIEEYLAGEYEDGDDYYFITTTTPDNRALDSLIDRVFGKAQQKVDVTSKGEKVIPILGGLSNVSENQGDIETTEFEEEA